MLLKQKNQTKILFKNRSNLWGSLKIKTLKRRKWKRLRRSLKIFKRSPRGLKKKLKINQQVQTKKYKLSLKKKQLFRKYYGNQKEKQLRSIFKKLLHKYPKSNQIQLIINEFETRIDIILLRLGFVNNLIESQQLIKHGKILINGVIVKSLNVRVKKNDIISIHPQCKYIIYGKIAYKLFLTNALLLHNQKTSFREVLRKHKYRHFFYIKKRKKRLSVKLKYRPLKDYKLFIYKNRKFMNYLNKQQQKPFSFFPYLRTTPNVLANYKYLIGIFLYNFNLNNLPYFKYINLYDILRYYNKQL